MDDRMPAWATVSPRFVQPVDWSAMLERRRKAAFGLLERSLAGVKGVAADGDVLVLPRAAGSDTAPESASQAAVP